jgi:hypothetical protein
VSIVPQGWQFFDAYYTRGSADAVATMLESEEVPAMIEVAGLLGDPGTEFRVFIPTYLAHRARWLLAQAEFTDSELDYLATGKLRRPE